MSFEIIFTEPSRKRHFSPPPSLSCVNKNTWRLGVNVNKHLSVSEHIRVVISSCTQTLHAICLLRCHGLSDVALQVINKTVVLTKMLLMPPALFTSAAERQLANGFIRAMRAGR